MAMAGVLPMLPHELPDEEGGTIRGEPPAGAQSVAVVRYPYASNLDELRLVPHAARMRWATRPEDIDGADMVLLPGSKHVAADTAWIRSHDLDDRLRVYAASGGRVLGVCGGAMVLGGEVDDPSGVEGATTGLGLLPLRTEMSPAKTTRRLVVEFPSLDPPWQALGGLRASGYEIRNGVVHGDECEVSPFVWKRGSVLATTVHGLLEHPDVVAALFGVRVRDPLEDTFDRLADAVDLHLDTRLLASLTSPLTTQAR
jgi:adenosylcobyric acid synthase